MDQFFGAQLEALFGVGRLDTINSVISTGRAALWFPKNVSIEDILFDIYPRVSVPDVSPKENHPNSSCLKDSHTATGAAKILRRVARISQHSRSIPVALFCGNGRQVQNIEMIEDEKATRMYRDGAVLIGCDATSSVLLCFASVWLVGGRSAGFVWHVFSTMGCDIS